MKILLKTSTALAKYLPPSARNNEVQVTVPDTATPEEVLTSQGFPVEINYLVTVNGSLVPRSERQTFKLSEGDTVSVLPPLKGG